MNKLSRLASLVMVLTIGICFESEGQTHPLFDKYDWLIDQVNPDDCAQTKIVEYDLGHYSFVDISYPGGADFFFQDGSLFCQSNPGYDCVLAYGFGPSDIGMQFECSGIPPDPCTGLSCDYPWLKGILDLNDCTSGKVDVYQSGTHRYLNVTTDTEIKLYYQDGTCYCTSSAGYDCPSLYGFTANDLVESQGCTTPATYCIGDSILIDTFQMDFIEFGPCQYEIGSDVDLVGTGEDCVIIDNLERCLNGQIIVDADGSFSIWYNLRGPSAGGGITVSGGSGSGTLIKENGAFLFCYGTDCKPANLVVTEDRIEFDIEIEFCLARFGGYR